MYRDTVIRFTKVLLLSIISLVVFSSGEVEAEAPVITVHSPENRTYPNDTIMLNYSLEGEADWVGYNLDGCNNVSLGNQSEGTAPLFSNIEQTSTTGYAGFSSSTWVAQAFRTTTCNITSVGLLLTALDTGGVNVSLRGDNGNEPSSVDLAKDSKIVNSSGWHYFDLDVLVNISERYWIIVFGDTTLKVNRSSDLYNQGGTSYTFDSGFSWIFDNSTDLAFTINQSTLDGQHNLTLYSNDSAGSMNSTSVYFTIDTKPPTVTILNPQNLTYNTPDLWFNASVIDVTSPVGLNVTVEVNGTNYTLDNTTGTWNKLVSIGADGNYAARFYANDIAGNANNTLVYFTLDLIQPEIAFVEAPTNNTWTTLDWVFINFTVNDTNLDSILIQWDNGSIANYSLTCVFSDVTSCSRNFTGQSENIISYSIFANDTAGNSNWTEERIIGLDSTYPEVAILSPLNALYNSATIHLNLSINETNLDWSGYTLNGDDIVPLDGNTSFNVSDGFHELLVRINDSVGHNDSASVNFTVDTKPPYSVVIHVQNHTNVSTDTLTFNWTACDATTSIASDVLLDDWPYVDALQTQNCTNTSYSVTFDEGAHNLTVLVRDAAGNTNASTLDFVFDETPPTLEDAAVIPDAIVEGSSVTLEVQATDSLSGIRTTWAVVTNSEFIETTVNLSRDNDTKWNASFNPEATGRYTVTFNARDYAGNSDFSAGIEFEVNAKKNNPGNNGQSGGGGGGGTRSSKGCVNRGRQRLNLSLLSCVLKKFGLKSKRFYSGPSILTPALTLTGDKTGDYPDLGFNLSEPNASITWDIYEVVAKKSMLKWPHPKKVVLARGDMEADAYAAIAYAKAMDCPILLTKPNALPSVTIDTLRKMNPEGIVIVGGMEAVSLDIEAELGNISKVERINGSNREETAVALARALKADGKKVLKAIIITDGRTPTASAALVSSLYDAPILYVSGDEVPRATMDLLLELLKEENDDGPPQIVFAGISEVVVSEIEGLLNES